MAILAIAGCTTSMFTWVALDTNDSAGEAEAFLLLLRERKTAEAYHETTTAHFRALQTPQEFDKMMELLGLPLTYRLDVWRDRTLELDNRSRIRGTLIDLGGQDVKFTVDVVREQGDWKINAFVDDDRANVGPGAWFKQIPLRDDLNVLTGKTMKVFRESIEAGDMSAFYYAMSDSFTIGITLERLQLKFQPYMDANYDLTGIEDLEPTYQELPVFEDVGLGIDEEDFTTIEDVMILRGYYPLTPEARSVQAQLRLRAPGVEALPVRHQRADDHRAVSAGLHPVAPDAGEQGPRAVLRPRTKQETARHHHRQPVTGSTGSIASPFVASRPGVGIQYHRWSALGLPRLTAVSRPIWASRSHPRRSGRGPIV